MNALAALNAVWTPHPQPSDTSQSGSPFAQPVTGRVLHISDGPPVSDGQGRMEALWRHPQWKTSLANADITITATRKQLTVTVPPIWRARVYLGWKSHRLHLSSSLRDIASKMDAQGLSVEGVAAFLAGDAAVAGLSPSIYAGIWEIQPGHAVTVSADQTMRCQRIWTPEKACDFDALHLSEATKRLHTSLQDVTDRILDTYDHVACLFSGGLDSSLTAAMLLRRAPERVVLFNVGSGLGTLAEAQLRQRLLHSYGARSTAVSISPGENLVRSLRSTNATSPFPSGSLFNHIFEEIIAAAELRGCDAIVTGDGGDEVFVEREEVLVDLLARRSSSVFAAAGHYALRNRERSAHTLWRARQQLQRLRRGSAGSNTVAASDALLTGSMADLVRTMRAATFNTISSLYTTGWTYSGLGSWRRAAAVPDWEPASAERPHFPVLSPLADAGLVVNALALRREEMVANTIGCQPKWLLRQAALGWLPPEVALHPKIGSADGHIMHDLRTRHHQDLLSLLSSSTARRLGVEIGSSIEGPDAPIWQGDAWIRTASLVAWIDQDMAVPGRPVITVASNQNMEDISHGAPTGAAKCEVPNSRRDEAALTRPSPWEVAILAVLNLAAQCLPMRRSDQHVPVPPRSGCASGQTPTATRLVDLARRACAFPLVTASSRIMVRALSWYLRITGSHPIVVRGSAKSHFMAQWWLEVDGSIVDVSGAETPLVPDRE